MSATTWTDLFGRHAEDEDTQLLRGDPADDGAEEENESGENDGALNNTAFFNLEGKLQRLKVKGPGLHAKRRSSITTTRSGFLPATPLRGLQQRHQLRSPAWQLQFSPSSQAEGFVDDDETFLDGAAALKMIDEDARFFGGARAETADVDDDAWLAGDRDDGSGSPVQDAGSDADLRALAENSQLSAPESPGRPPSPATWFGARSAPMDKDAMIREWPNFASPRRKTQVPQTTEGSRDGDDDDDDAASEGPSSLENEDDRSRGGKARSSAQCQARLSRLAHVTSLLSASREVEVDSLTLRPPGAALSHHRQHQQQRAKRRAMQKHKQSKSKPDATSSSTASKTKPHSAHSHMADAAVSQSDSSLASSAASVASSSSSSSSSSSAAASSQSQRRRRASPGSNPAVDWPEHETDRDETRLEELNDQREAVARETGKSRSRNSSLASADRLAESGDEELRFTTPGRSKLVRKSLRKLQDKFPKPPSNKRLLNPPRLLFPDVIKDSIHLQCEVGMTASFQVPIRNESSRRVVLRPVVRDKEAQRSLKVTPARCVIEPGAANTVMLAFCPRADTGTNWWRVDLVEDASASLHAVKVMTTTLRSLWVAPDRPIINVGGAALGGAASSRVELENKTDGALDVCAFLEESAPSSEVDDDWGEASCGREDGVRAFGLRLGPLAPSMTSQSLMSTNARPLSRQISEEGASTAKKLGWFRLAAGEIRTVEVDFLPETRLRHNAVLRVRSRRCTGEEDAGFVNSIQIPVMGYGGRAQVSCAGQDAWVDVVEVGASQSGAHKVGTFVVENRGDREAFVRARVPEELKHRVTVDPEWCTLAPGASETLHFRALSPAETTRVAAVFLDWGDEILRRLRTRAKSMRGAVADIDLNETMTSVSRLDELDDPDALNMVLAALEPYAAPVARNTAIDLAHFFDEYLFDQNLHCTIVEACLDRESEPTDPVMAAEAEPELEGHADPARMSHSERSSILKISRRALKVEPHECWLAYDRSRGLWTAPVSVQNTADVPAQVRADLPLSLESSRGVTTIAPQERTTFEIRSRDYVAGPRQVYICSLASSLDADQVVVRHASHGAALTLEPPDVVNFPATAPGEKSSALLRIKNHGDVALALELRTSEQFDVRSKHRRIAVRARGFVELKVYFRPYATMGRNLTCAGHLRILPASSGAETLLVLLQGKTH